jgi:hypothetical protein
MVAWRHGAAKLGGMHGVATMSVEARPHRGGCGGAPAVAVSFVLAQLKWPRAVLAGLACDSRLRVAPGRLLGIVAAPASCQVTAAAGSLPSSLISVDRWLEVGQWSTLLLYGGTYGSLLIGCELKGDSLERV